MRILDIVEKPEPDEAPSNLAVMGRYVFTPEIFEELEQVQPGVGGEIQLTDAIAMLLADQAVYGYVFAEGRYDIGKKLDYLRATVELALDRDDLGPEFRAFLAELVQSAGWSEPVADSMAARPARRGPGRSSSSALRGRSPPSSVPLADALGLRAGRRRCVAAEAVPPFANTAMDGFAVRAADTAGRHRRCARCGCGWSARIPAGRAADVVGRAGRGDPHHDRRADARRRRRGGDGRAHAASSRRRDDGRRRSSRSTPGDARASGRRRPAAGRRGASPPATC